MVHKADRVTKVREVKTAVQVAQASQADLDQVDQQGNVEPRAVLVAKVRLLFAGLCLVCLYLCVSVFLNKITFMLSSHDAPRLICQ